MMSGPASGITIWCARCCTLSCGPGTGPASRRSSCGRPNGSSPRARHGARPATSWRPRQAGRALALMQDRVVTDFLRDPELPAPLDLSTVDPSLLADAPDRLLGLAADLLLSGDPARGGEYLDLLERAQPSIPPESRLAARFAAMRSFHYALTGQLDKAVRTRRSAARAIQERTQLTDEWDRRRPVDPAACLPRAWKTTRRSSARQPRPWRCPRAHRTGQAGAGARRAGAGMVRGRPPGRSR